MGKTACQHRMMEKLRLSFGDIGSGHVTFGPLSGVEGWRAPDGSFQFLDAPITIRARSGDWSLSDRNGIEPLALAHLRSDLETLRAAGRGAVLFGDHDFGSIVELKATESGRIRVVANNPSADAWHIEITELPIDALEGLIDQIDAIEREFGQLTGHCGCGSPSSSYYAEWPDPGANR